MRVWRVGGVSSAAGFREWIFSGKAGSLGLFAAGAEFAFGTIVQRTMAEPGGARFHYGHPDVWNKCDSWHSLESQSLVAATKVDIFQS